MIKKLTHIVMALFIGLFTCSIEGQFRCETPGEIPFGGGIVQPLVPSEYGPDNQPSVPGDYGPNNPRQQLNVDEQIQGTRSAPAPGIGLMQIWSF